MTPGVWPLVANEVTAEQAFERGNVPLRAFLQKNVREKDLKLFVDMSNEAEAAKPEDLSLRVLIPAFMISELKRAFEIGFLLFLPFLIIDLVVASVLMSMPIAVLTPRLHVLELGHFGFQPGRPMNRPMFPTLAMRLSRLRSSSRALSWRSMSAEIRSLQPSRWLNVSSPSRMVDFRLPMGRSAISAAVISSERAAMRLMCSIPLSLALSMAASTAPRSPASRSRARG